jgi:hypothetical protein
VSGGRIERNPAARGDQLLTSPDLCHASKATIAPSPHCNIPTPQTASCSTMQTLKMQLIKEHLLHQGMMPTATTTKHLLKQTQENEIERLPTAPKARQLMQQQLNMY